MLLVLRDKKMDAQVFVCSDTLMHDAKLDGEFFKASI